MTRTPSAWIATALAAGIVAVAATSAGGQAEVTPAQDREQSTQLISKALGGGTPDGASTHGVISGDRRFARIIAFESEATNLVRGDTNGVKDVFVVKRAGTVDNTGSKWSGGNAILVSRGVGGQPANGPSSSPSVSGDFRHDGACIAFLSAASNLVDDDTNGKVDAFLVRSAGDPPERVSLPGGAQSAADTTAVTVSGDCSRVSFVNGGRLYTLLGNTVRAFAVQGTPSDPSYATGNSNALVFTARSGVYLSSDGTSRAQFVARGGRNPAFNDIKRRTLTYEKKRHRRYQIYYKDIGKSERIISRRGRRVGNGNSLNPVIGNSGFYVTFETTSSNLSVNAANQTGDRNRRPDSYLFTDSRDITLVQSVKDKAVPLPGGGQNPSMSFYANYILFDSPAPLGAQTGAHQIFMRYLGGI